jgi:hypothetical protein
MVGARKNFPTLSPDKQAFASDHRLIILRQAQRRSVLGSGKRVGSWHSGVACSQLLPSLQTASQACCRQ